jgi:aarF domain-containing kinase
MFRPSTAVLARVRGPRLALPRTRWLWLVPVAGGALLYGLPRRPETIPKHLYSSPALIPARAQELVPIILSPSEVHLDVPSRVRTFLREHVWEPILTARRFAYLFFLFVPVIVSSPMLLVGSQSKRYRGDRWGAVWWYGFLTKQMEAAGPTFIKVCDRPRRAELL